MRRLIIVLSVVVVVCAIGVLAVVSVLQAAGSLASTVVDAIADDSDGQAIAGRTVRVTAEDLTSAIGYVPTAVDAETLAATTFTSSTGSPARMTPLAWSGAGTADSPAVVEVRIDAVITAIISTGLGSPSRSAGAAVACYRFMLAHGRDAESSLIDCPDPAAPLRTPVATPLPHLPADAADRLRAVLGGDTAEQLEQAVRSAFPDPATTVETTVTDVGETVVAVGVAAARECVVLVRQVDGAIENVAFRPIHLEPGEAGCSTTLYTNPPL